MQLGLTKREIAEVEAQLQATQREKKRGVLTRGELDRVGDGTPMYQSVGERRALHKWKAWVDCVCVWVCVQFCLKCRL